MRLCAPFEAALLAKSLCRTFGTTVAVEEFGWRSHTALKVASARKTTGGRGIQLEGSAIAGMTIPDALTPQQYYDGVRADDASARPVKRLMLAVLEDAMRCYQTYANSHNGNQRRLFVDAEAWLMDRRADGPFAFETVCETLGIEPSCLREGLRRWRGQQLDGMKPCRLARRSPVTRTRRISSPLRRRRQKACPADQGDSDDAERSHSTAVALRTIATPQAIAIPASPTHTGDNHHNEIAGNGADADVSVRIEVRQIAVI
jgi:hypothetical protein